MMVRVLLLVVASLFFEDCLCQEIEIIKMVQTNSVQASTRRRDDTKGEACALLKVQFPIEKARFSGNIVGDVEFRTNEYWIYMPEGTTEIEITHETFPSKIVHFSEFEIESLKSKYTYELTLLGKRKDAPKIYNEGMIAWAENDMVKAFCSLNQAAKEGYKYAYNSLAKMFTLPNATNSSFYNEINHLALQFDSKKETLSDTLLNTDNNMDIIAVQNKDEIRKKAIQYEKEHNYERAIYWYQRGDEKGDHVSQYCLGRLYYEGIGIRQNYQKAIELFQKASCTLDDFYKLMDCHGYSGGGGFYTATFAKVEDKYRSEAMNALAYMYMNGIGTLQNQKNAILYSWLSGSDTGKNILGLSYYKEKNYKKAFELINIQSVPEFCFVDSFIRKDAYFSLGMKYYWSLAGHESLSLAKDYFKEAAKLGDKRAKMIVDATCIGNVTSNGIITSNKIVMNGQEGVISLGKIRNDGVILFGKENVVGGRIDSQGVFWNANNVEQGYIDNKGNVYDIFPNEKIGSVDNSGNVVNINGKIIGRLNGLPVKYGLLYFFFDDVANTQWTDFKPDMKE